MSEGYLGFTALSRFRPGEITQTNACLAVATAKVETDNLHQTWRRPGLVM